MRKDKQEAFKLRREGKTYTEIRAILGVSKGTLSLWFKNFDWANDISSQKSKFNYSPEKVKAMHAARRKQLKDLYLLMKEEAEAEFEKYKHEPAFVAGLIAYAGEGDKLNERLARITNTDPRILLVFKRFISVYYPTYFNKMRVSVLLYPDIDSPTCLKWWSDSLGMSLDKFYKPVVIEGKHKTRRLQYGVSTLIIGSKSFKTKLLRLIDLVLET